MEIDVTHPGVQKLLRMSGGGDGHLAPGKKKLVHMAGDQDTGTLTTMRLDANKLEVLVFYRSRDLWMTVDVYKVPGEPVNLHFLCPKCENALSIPGHKKDIDFDGSAVNPLLTTILASPPPDWDLADVQWLRAVGARGEVSCERFQCTWELPGTHELCRWKAVFDKNICKDA